MSEFFCIEYESAVPTVSVEKVQVGEVGQCELYINLEVTSSGQFVWSASAWSGHENKLEEQQRYQLETDFNNWDKLVEALPGAIRQYASVKSLASRINAMDLSYLTKGLLAEIVSGCEVTSETTKNGVKLHFRPHEQDDALATFVGVIIPPWQRDDSIIAQAQRL